VLATEALALPVRVATWTTALIIQPVPPVTVIVISAVVPVGTAAYQIACTLVVGDDAALVADTPPIVTAEIS
jgi:hypothetical protein